MIVELDPRKWFRRTAQPAEAAPVETEVQPVQAWSLSAAALPVMTTVDVPANAVESDMNFGAILALILKLAPVTVLTIQKVVGDAQSGADKKTMAQDALSGATSAALSVLGGDQSIYAQLASAVASEAIDASVAFTKVTGAYQKATTDAKALQTAAPAAAK